MTSFAPTDRPTKPPAQQFFAGALAEAPILVGAMPLGVAFGVGATASGLGGAATQGFSSIVFGGSSQFVALQMLAGGAPWLLVALTIFVVNLRHALYSASLAPHLARLGFGWKALLAYLLTDEAYAVAIVHYERAGDRATSHWYLFGAGLTLWAGWQLGTLIGAVAGAAVPASWQLDFLLPLVFIGLLVPLVRDGPMATAALVAGVVAVSARSLPYRLHFILAILAGIAAGVVVERIRTR
ncbi:MAG TPA: AzlC family ABC transporter permease [Opitutaceae bacterium]